MGYDRHDLDHRLAVRPRADLTAFASAARRLGLARPLRIWAAGGARRALHPLAHAGNPRVSQCRKTAADVISELLRRQPVSVLLALGAAVISNSSYYLLLYIPTYGVKPLHRPAYTTFAATLIGAIILAVFSVIVGHYSDRTKPRTQLMLIHGLAVFARRLSVILADGRLSLARHRDIRRRFPQPDQGGLQRRLAVGAVGAVSSRDARRRSVVQLQRIGNDLRRIRPIYGDVADRADRRSAVARLLPDGHRAAQHHRAHGDRAARAG